MPHIAQRPVMRRSPDGGLSFPRCSSSGYRYEVAIQSALPNRPATVPTGDRTTGTSRLLVLDLDIARVPADHAADRPGHIATITQQIATLLADCGITPLVDVSPSGGRHIYILWDTPIQFAELRHMAKALAARFPVIDTAPMEHTDGQIRGPGSPHRSSGGHLTGYMTLTCDLAEAERICHNRPGNAEWAALQVEMTAELDTIATRHHSPLSTDLEAHHPDAPDALPGVELDTSGTPWRPRLGGRTPLRPDLEHLARTGQWDPARYTSSSEARQALLSSAAARGWRLEHIRAALAKEWKAISTWWRDARLLQAEWIKAVTYTATPPAPPSDQEVGKPVQQRNTSEYPLTRAAPPLSLASVVDGGSGWTVTASHLDKVRSGNPWNLTTDIAPWGLTTYQRIRTWQHAMRIVERLQEFEWGERALTYRAILRALGAAAQMTGRLEIEFGTRQLAYMAALDHTTVSRALHDLRQGPLALIDLVKDAEGIRADVYQLVIPDQVAAQASRRAWRPGRITAIHPAFRTLSRGAAFAYEALTTDEMSVTELGAAALLTRTTTYQALKELSCYGLAERGPGGGWRRGPADLEQLATRNGGRTQADQQLAGHRADRTEWHTFLGVLSSFTTPLPHPEPVTHRGSVALRPSGRLGLRDLYPPAPRPAPPWLRPPSRQRPITDSDLVPPVDLQVPPAAVLDGISGCEVLPVDLRMVIAADRAVIVADEESLERERADYEEALADLRQATVVRHDDPLSRCAALSNGP
ncbi:hypothetical protein [Actinomadura kijaniata]|uniref:hypothetical protein n=1 Tax=Actinomadura kijaniata TaxID=46161 RepID=UPI00082C4C74|nr:hypothetical protein [Actinomadura kijaniata]